MALREGKEKHTHYSPDPLPFRPAILICFFSDLNPRTGSDTTPMIPGANHRKGAWGG